MMILNTISKTGIPTVMHFNSNGKNQLDWYDGKSDISNMVFLEQYKHLRWYSPVPILAEAQMSNTCTLC